MNEMEIKILDIDINAVRKKMIEIGAVKVKEENQTNKLFDFPDKKLLSGKGYARIRIVENLLASSMEYYMTVKKMLSQEKFKVMEEHEVKIDNSEAGENIFKSLGLELVQSIKKYRESYKYKSALIEIDVNDKSFCPFPYVEIETTNEEELEEVVKLLGYTMEQTTSSSIFEILNNYKSKP